MNETKIANELLERQVVKLSANREFVWASGIHSPVYCDNRKLLAFPDTRKYIVNVFTEIIKRKYPQAELVAGVATGAIAWGVLIAEALNLPFAYVRPSKKAHGLNNQVEGKLGKEQKIVVIEDLISTGGSSLNAVEALRSMSAQVLGMLALFTYNLPTAQRNFKESTCELECLSNFDVLLNEAVRTNYISPEESEAILRWRNEQ